MATYECQNFKDGQVLTADCLNKIEKALEEACNKEVTSASINDSGELIIIFADATQLNCGCVASSGKGIESVVLNDNGTLTFTYTDGTTDVTESVRGKSAYETAQDGGYKGTEEEFAEMLANGNGGGGGGGSVVVQADYAQNDSTATDYIKNRPFYEGEPIQTEVSLSETLMEAQLLDEFTFNESFGTYMQDTPTSFAFVIGETYRVIWDNEEYKAVAQDVGSVLAGRVALGNCTSYGFTGNDEPFAIVTSEGLNPSVFALKDTEATPHTVAIYKEPDTFTYTTDEGFVSKGTPSSEMLALWLSDWENCTFTWDGEEYVCEPKYVQGVLKCIGNVDMLQGTGDSGEPFAMMCADAAIYGADVWMVCDVATEVSNTTADGDTVAHEMGLVINAPNIKKIDPKFLPNSAGGSSLPEVTADDNGKFLRVVDGAWTAVALTDVSQEGV